MGRYVPNSGPEFLSTGGVILYFGVDSDAPGKNRHISMPDEDRITQNELASLDTKVRTGTVPSVIVELNKPHLKPWWLRVQAYLQANYPVQAPVDMFISAWLRNA